MTSTRLISKFPKICGRIGGLVGSGISFTALETYDQMERIWGSGYEPTTKDQLKNAATAIFLGGPIGYGTGFGIGLFGSKAMDVALRSGFPQAVGKFVKKL